MSSRANRSDPSCVRDVSANGCIFFVFGTAVTLTCVTVSVVTRFNFSVKDTEYQSEACPC